jgi:pimeloyl-ACP methyl ester carboxylesterase
VPPVRVGYRRPVAELAANVVRYNGRGVTLAADEWPAAGAPVVVLMHGGGQTRHAWRSTGSHLAEAGYHVVSLDLRGHGDSDWAPDGDYLLARMVEDLGDVADAVGRPVALVGASLGGITALVAAGTVPGLASAVVLVDIVARIEMAGAQRIRSFMTANPDGFATLDEAADAVALYVPERPRPRDPSGLAKNLRRRADGRWYWHWDPAFLPAHPYEPRHSVSELEDAASRLTVPTLVVRGGLSDVVSDDGVRDFLRIVPAAEYVNVTGAGHMVAGDRNDVFSAAVVEFLGRSVPSARG